jgi:hypothetical protein
VDNIFQRIIIQYAVKFVCGKSKGVVVAPGQYWTAINVHNPWHGKEGEVHFRKKVAFASPVTDVPKFEEPFTKLQPDQALEIDCNEIPEQAGVDFVKGFVVIQSDRELDVVAVYTAAGVDGQIETLHTERVSPRRLQSGPLGLIPVPDEMVPSAE